MKRLTNRTQTNETRGAAALELAIVLPILMVLVLGCVDFGRVMHVSIVLNNAAGAGLAYASTNRYTDFNSATWTANVREAVLDELGSIPAFDEDYLTFSAQAVTEADDTVRVTVTASYFFQTVVEWPLMPNQLTLRQSFVARQYR